MEKICTHCGKQKPLEDFYRNHRRKASWQSACKACNKLKATLWKKINPEKVKEIDRKISKKRTSEYRRKIQLRFKYGITQAQFKDMLDKQYGACSICKVFLSVPHIDHCHKTGKVRGLLCCHCNRGLGGFKDSIDLLKEAVYYLSK